MLESHGRYTEFAPELAMVLATIAKMLQQTYGEDEVGAVKSADSVVRRRGYLQFTEESLASEDRTRTIREATRMWGFRHKAAVYLVSLQRSGS